MRLFLPVAALASALVLVTGGAPVAAAPKAPPLGPGVDALSGYEGQSKCSPEAKPGMVAFQNLVMRAYPSTGAGYISRACSSGGQSEHKEGRAWDWSVNAGVSSQRAAAEDLFDWLLDRDRFGNRFAMARRLGIMYMIFNRKTWSPWSGWEVYCKQKPRGCVDPDDGDLRDPHTSHVHFSLTWAGARKETTFWHEQRSLVTGAAGSPTGSGYWSTTGNGSVLADGPGHYGSKDQGWLEKPVVAIDPSATGAGYYLLSRAGRVWAFGDARGRGSVDSNAKTTGIAASPTGAGYWVTSKKGRVWAFGSVPSLGGATDSGKKIVGISPTPTGLGYRLWSESGEVFAFGDALELGDASRSKRPIVAGEAHGSGGYWLVTDRGRVYAFGDAPKLGGATDEKRGSPIAGMAATATGAGYRLVTEKGKVFAFGDAQ